VVFRLTPFDRGTVDTPERGSRAPIAVAERLPDAGPSGVSSGDCRGAVPKKKDAARFCGPRLC